MPNNPPCPVVNSITIAKHSGVKCDQIKAKYNIKTRKHAKGGSGNIESHHILQDKAMTGLISKYSGHAVLLTIPVHRRINALQIARNCPGPGPATFGALQKSARDDLKKVFTGKKHNGSTMTAAEAKIAADCLVAEAVKKTQKYRRNKKPKKPYLTQNSPVKTVAGCFAYGTLIWLNNGVNVPVEYLQPGDLIETNTGPMAVVRTSTCVTTLVELEIGEARVSMAPFHHVHLANGHTLKSGLLKAGQQVETACGPQRIKNIQFIEFTHEVVSFSIEGFGACRIGECGLLVDMPHLDHRVSKIVNISPIDSRAGLCRN